MLARQQSGVWLRWQPVEVPAPKEPALADADAQLLRNELFRKLATFGVVFDPGTIRTVKACYYRIALDLIESYANDAQMNGLSLDRHAEENAVELFASNVLQCG